MEEEEKSKKVNKKVAKKTIEIHSEEVIREALKKFVSEKMNKRQTDDEIEAMVSVCSEFLKSFIILGYDFEGKAINPIFYAKSELDADALSQYMQKFFMSQMY